MINQSLTMESYIHEFLHIYIHIIRPMAKKKDYSLPYPKIKKEDASFFGSIKLKVDKFSPPYSTFYLTVPYQYLEDLFLPVFKLFWQVTHMEIYITFLCKKDLIFRN